MGYRLLKYKTRLWDSLIKKMPRRKTLPPILALVLSQTKTGWKASTSFQDLLDIEDPELKEALAPYTPRFQYLLVDLTTFDEEQIMGNIWNHLVLSFMKAARAGKIPELLKQIKKFSNQIHSLNTLGLLEALLRYTLETDEILDQEKLVQLVSTSLNPKTGESVMTLAEKLRKEGFEEGRSLAEKLRKEGKEEGRIEGLRKTLLKMFCKRFGEDQALVKLVDSIKQIGVLEELVDTFLESPDKDTIKDKIQNHLNENR